MAGWYSQPFRPDGGITGEGLLNQLGRPSLSLLTVLVRESAQNSWDAKTSDAVSFGLDLVTVSPAHRHAWVELLAPNAPPSASAPRALPALLRGPTIRYLAVSDRGTSGLGGPTRSDVYAEPNQRGWLSFVLNSGERQDIDGGGGTYGYGKGAFFLASRVRTILIYTRFRDGFRIRSRLIGSALLGSTVSKGVPYTGRHWWGLPGTTHCDPFSDQAADTIAHRLGLPGFGSGQTGTTVVVLDPDLSDPSVPEDEAGDMSPESAGRHLAGAAAWNLWPLTLADRSVRMHVSVSVHGVAVPVPGEHDDPVLANFAAAYREATSEQATTVSCLRPRQDLGRFGLQNTFGSKTDSPAAAELGIAGSPHHVALMRRPDLVVQYLPGPPKPHPEAGYTAVFKVNDEVDPIFSRSEPPTHDAWVDAQLTGRHATYVRVARRRILERCAAIAQPRTQTPQTVAVPVGGIAHRLGFLVASVGGNGAAFPAPPTDGVPHEGRANFAASADGGSGAGARGRGVDTQPGLRAGRKPLLIGSPFFASRAGKVVLVQRVRALGPARLRGEVGVVTGEGALETARPVGGAIPEILGWRSDVSETCGEFVDLGEGTSELELLVLPIADAAVSISVEKVDNG